jgi:hypothetical protein
MDWAECTSAMTTWTSVEARLAYNPGEPGGVPGCFEGAGGMTSLNRAVAMIAGLAIGLVASGAWAEEESRAEFNPRVELTPYVGYRMGGQFDIEDAATDTSTSVDVEDSSDWGIDLGIYRDRRSFYEILYSYQSAGLDTNDSSLKGTDLTIQYLQVGGTLLFDDHDNYVPYLSLTVGGTKFDAGGGYGSETKFSGSLGGGVRFPIGDRFAATLGARGYLTVVNSDTEFFCTGSGSVNCLFRTSGSTFFQGEALLGFTAIF